MTNELQIKFENKLKAKLDLRNQLIADINELRNILTNKEAELIETNAVIKTLQDCLNDIVTNEKESSLNEDEINISENEFDE